MPRKTETQEMARDRHTGGTGFVLFMQRDSNLEMLSMNPPNESVKQK